MLSKTCLTFALLLLAFLSCGCGAINKAYDTQQERFARLNYQDPLHINSCGPKAIREALSSFKITCSLEEISAVIQKENSAFKCFLSIFDNSAREITWPSEIKSFFANNQAKYQLKVIELKDFKDLPENSVAIILIKKRYSLRHYHWITHPTYSESLIKSYFNDRTSVILIYQIKRIN